MTFYVFKLKIFKIFWGIFKILRFKVSFKINLPASQSSKSDCNELMYSIADLKVVTWKTRCFNISWHKYMGQISEYLYVANIYTFECAKCLNICVCAKFLNTRNFYLCLFILLLLLCLINWQYLLQNLSQNIDFIYRNDSSCGS